MSDDRPERLRQLSNEIAELGTWKDQMSAQRRVIVLELADEGYSHHRIAVICGLTHGRISQIIHGRKRPSGCPDPEAHQRQHQGEP